MQRERFASWRCPQTTRCSLPRWRKSRRRGDTRGALDAIARLKAASPGRYVSPMLFAWIHLALNDDAEALVWLKKAVAEHDSALTSLKVNPTYDRVRRSPEFVEVLQTRRAGVTSRTARLPEKRLYRPRRCGEVCVCVGDIETFPSTPGSRTGPIVPHVGR